MEQIAKLHAIGFLVAMLWFSAASPTLVDMGICLLGASLSAMLVVMFGSDRRRAG